MKKSNLILTTFLLSTMILKSCGEASNDEAQLKSKSEEKLLKEEIARLKSEVEEKRLKEEEDARLRLEAEKKRLKEVQDVSSKEVTIGGQVWMTANLNVNKFRNGEPIPQARTAEEWKQAGANGQAAWCYFNNDQANGIKYGKLYNWFAVHDPRGLAPRGWKVPSNSDFLVLTKFIGQDFKSKMMLESAWPMEDHPSNIYRFSGLPSGLRDNAGTFRNLGLGGYFWTSTVSHQNFSYARELGKNAGNWASHEFGTNQFVGMSVRCVRE